MAGFVLYHTLGCHLCDDAETILKEAAISYEKFDIADTDALIETFGEMIPVLMYLPTNQYLPWPFDANLLQEFQLHCEKP